MRRTRNKCAVVCMLGLAVIAAACSSDDKTTTTNTGSSTNTSSSSVTGLAIDYTALTGTLTGSGSSFQDTFDQAVITAFKGSAASVSLTYTKSGSGQGIGDLGAGTKNFAGTDRPVKDAEKAAFTGGDILYFPTVAAPITVSYNVSGIDKSKPLQLDGPTLTKI